LGIAIASVPRVRYGPPMSPVDTVVVNLYNDTLVVVYPAPVSSEQRGSDALLPALLHSRARSRRGPRGPGPAHCQPAHGADGHRHGAGARRHPIFPKLRCAGRPAGVPPRHGAAAQLRVRGRRGGAAGGATGPIPRSPPPSGPRPSPTATYCGARRTSPPRGRRSPDSAPLSARAPGPGPAPGRARLRHARWRRCSPRATSRPG
jgi:hypothetical protein